MSENIFKIKAKLRDLFPADDPDSAWLLRLAMLRDDFEYEIVPKGERDDDPTGVWLSIYSWRKIAITIGEVKSIFSHDLVDYIEREGRKWPGGAIQTLGQATQAVAEADKVFGPIRDGLGAHVRPANAVQSKQKIDPTPKILQRQADEEFEVTLDIHTGRHTSFCGVTATAFIFAWPDVTTNDDYAKVRMKLHDTFMACFNPIRHGIDLVMTLHWEKTGLLKREVTTDVRRT